MNDSREGERRLEQEQEAVRVMLLTTRLPSMTTAGREIGVHQHQLRDLPRRVAAGRHGNRAITPL